MHFYRPPLGPGLSRPARQLQRQWHLEQGLEAGHFAGTVDEDHCLQLLLGGASRSAYSVGHRSQGRHLVLDWIEAEGAARAKLRDHGGGGLHSGSLGLEQGTVEQQVSWCGDSTGAAIQSEQHHKNLLP